MCWVVYNHREDLPGKDNQFNTFLDCAYNYHARGHHYRRNLNMWKSSTVFSGGFDFDTVTDLFFWGLIWLQLRIWVLSSADPMLDLHKFLVAMSRIEVNVIKPRASSPLVIVDHASAPGVPGQLLVQLVPFPCHSGGCSCLALQCKHFLEFTSFLATLHWPHCAADFGRKWYFSSWAAGYVRTQLWSHARRRCIKKGF